MEGPERAMDREAYETSNEIANDYFGSSGIIPDEELGYERNGKQGEEK